jgi:hypothetical protein
MRSFAGGLVTIGSLQGKEVKLVTIRIEEEYGYRTWKAVLTEEEYKEVLRRWETMKGLYCSVPVQLIIPQAVEIDDSDPIINVWKANDMGVKFCHIHECDDSYISGSEYVIPEYEDHLFFMDGVQYTYKDLCALKFGEQ